MPLNVKYNGCGEGIYKIKYLTTFLVHTIRFMFYPILILKYLNCVFWYYKHQDAVILIQFKDINDQLIF